MDESRQGRNCAEYCVQLSLYLDGELDDEEKKVVESHLRGCGSCRETFNKERWFLEGLRRSAPLHVVPNGLRRKVNSIVEDTSVTASPSSAPEFRHSVSTWFSVFAVYRRRSGFAAVLTSLLVVAGLWGIVQKINPTQSLTFASTAVDVHQRHTLGRLPLELISESPDRISSWFEGKVPFSLQLPNYQDISGQKKLYRLKGARLIGFRNDYAAYVAYEMGQHPISLVVTSSASAEPEGGEIVASKGLIIHYETISGLKVITWSHRDLTYALVSNLEERGQQSCLVCHQGVKDKDFIGGLESIGLSVATR